MSSSRLFAGLRSKLILAIVAAGALPIAIALAVAYAKGENQLREVIGESFEALAGDNARKIGSELQRVLDGDSALARKAAANPIVRSWLERANPGRLPWPDRPDDYADAPLLVASWVAAAPVSEHSAAIMHDRVGALELDQKTKRYVFQTHTPIETLGWLTRSYDASKLLDPLVYPIRFGDTGHVMLIDGTGTVLSCPFLPTGSTASGWEHLAAVATAEPGWLQAGSDGHGGHELSLIGHAPVTLSGQRIAEHGWYTFVWQDSGEIFAPAYSLRTGIATAAAFAFALLAILGYYASRRIVAPIRALEAGARRIAGGNLDEAIVISTHDEIEALARQFDEMRQQLRTLIGSLEERVEERTRALNKTQAEKERIVEQLIQAEKIAAIGTMASGIGHEINNPLYAILSAAETIRDTAGVTACRDDAQAIVDRCKHIAATVRNLSGYARPGDGHSTTAVDVNSRLREALAMANRSQLGDKLTIVEEFGQVPPVRGKPEEIQQAFFNIMRNAIQAMDGNGTLTLESRYANPHVVVKISDTGSGIPKENLSKIFDPFFTTKGPDEGEGLGLYVVQQTLAKNGCTITVDSRDGAGTAFTMTFPAAAIDRRVQDATQDPGDR